MIRFLGFSFLLGCAASEDLGAQTAADLQARANETTVWLDETLTTATRNGAPAFLLHGRASRDIVDGTSFVFDDPYGSFQIPSQRTFEVFWRPSEIRSLLNGVNQFIRLTFRQSSVTARVTVRPKLEQFRGSGSYLAADVAPIVLAAASSIESPGAATAGSTAYAPAPGRLPYRMCALWTQPIFRSIFSKITSLPWPQRTATFP